MKETGADERLTALHAAVNQAVENGLSVWPPRQDGSKAPSGNWKHRQTTPATMEELLAIYRDSAITGIGLVAGKVSGNLECLDFDESGIYDAFRQLAIASGMGELIERIESGYFEYSPNGVHYLYKCSEIGSSTKLATRPKRPEEMKDEHDKTKTLIETRGNGGYVVVAPSYGTVNPSGSYNLVTGSFSTIATITPEERNNLFTLARAFHIDAEEKVFVDRNHRGNGKAGGRPGDDYNERATWPEILIPHGWAWVYTHNKVGYWRRPGKSIGISATVNHQGNDLFHNFSSSTPFDPDRSYTKFSAYAILNHAGDFTKAAKAIVAEGYGEPQDSDRNRVRKRHIVMQKFYPRPFTEQILAEHSFLWEGKHGNLWRFHKGKAIWMPDGEAFIEAYFRDATAALDDTLKKKNVVTEIIADIAGCSYAVAGFPEPPIYLIPFVNGVYDIQHNCFRERCADDYFTWVIPWRYDPDAKSTFLKGLLDQTLTESDTTLYELMAYALWRGYPYQKFFLLIGPGSNGKGVFITIFSRLVGPDNISGVSLREIQGSNFAAGTLDRKLANISGEMDYTDLSNTSLLKQLTGGDPIQADRKYLTPVRFVNHAKLIFATNQVPVTRDCTDAFYRRAFLVEFPNTFQADPTIDIRIREESVHMTCEFEGLLYEVIQNLRCLIDRRFIFQVDQDTATVRKRYEGLSNPMRQFITERCNETFSSDDYIYKFEFKEQINVWLKDRHFNTFTDERIKREMQAIGHESGQRGEKRYHSWTGIKWGHSQTSQTSHPCLNRSSHIERQFRNPCELCEPCEQPGLGMPIVEVAANETADLHPECAEGPERCGVRYVMQIHTKNNDLQPYCPRMEEWCWRVES